MNLLKIALANIRSKPLNAALSLILLSFGVGIISLLLLLDVQLRDQFNRNIKDIDFVLAAKGSAMQSILANVYHVDAPTGNIKVEDAKRIIRSPMVKEYIPIALGDNYEKHRIVGTNKKYPEHYSCMLREGKLFEKPFEVTIGGNVADETGLKIGDIFTSVHGYDNAADAEAHHHDAPFTVVGIFEQSNIAIDNLILTPVESVWLVHEHGNEEPALPGDNDEHEAESDSTHEHHEHAAAEHHDPTTDPNREMTAYLLKKANRGAFGMLSRQVEDTNMQLANVAVENSRLLNNFGMGFETMRIIAILIMLISFLSVFISLYNSLKERKYELALMRTMGGSRNTLFRLILGEGLLLSIIGFVIGIALSRIAMLILSSVMKENFKYSFDQLGIIGPEFIMLGITLLVGILASMLPAVRAFKMDISKTLTNG